MALHRALAGAALLCVAAASLPAQQPEAGAIAPDSPRWRLQGRTAVTDYLGRRSLMLNGGQADVADLVFQDGVVDFDVATPAARGFFGVQFRADSANGEFVYLRQHKSGLPDALQYTPVLSTGLNWQLYSGSGFTARANVPRDTWFHVRLVVAGAQATLYVGDTLAPALVMTDLKTGRRGGDLGLVVLTGETYFSNVVVRPTPPASWERRHPPMPAGTLTRWSLSPAFDALLRDLERPLTRAEAAAMHWQDVEVESPGLLAISRYRESPHPRVTFQSDFATRLQPQPGTSVVYARTAIIAERAKVVRLHLGYSDEVSVFLNGRILYRGRSAQSFRDPGFLGIADPENDVVYLPLARGSNELVLAVSELGGGWGFIARLEDLRQ